MINQKKIELKCAILRKYLEKTQLMKLVISDGDFDAFENLIGEREELIRSDDGEVFKDSLEVIALARLIMEEQVDIDELFSKYRDDVQRAYNENKRDIKVVELNKRVGNVYQGSNLNLGSSFDYKK